MAKIVISFLGTGGFSDKNKRRGDYKKAKYIIDKETYESEFVADVLKRHYGADKIIFIGTLKSMWEVVYDKFVDASNDNDWESLSKIVEESNYKTDIKYHESTIKGIFDVSYIIPILLKYGIDDDENEYNVNKLFEIEELLNNDDELYIDISHSFRSLPHLLTNILNFIIENSKKNIEIKGISYAMFEIKNEMDDLVPVISLNKLMELNETIKASHEFKEYGYAYLFSDILENTDKSLSSILRNFSISRSFNHFYGLKNKIKQLRTLKYDNLDTIQQNTLPVSVNEFVKRFDKAKQDSHYQYELACWMFYHKEYGSSAIVLVESLITKLCELENLDFTTKANRDHVKDLLFSNVGLYTYRDFNEVWKDANEIRKSVAHSIGNKQTGRGMVKMLKNYIEKAKKLIYQ